jgi:uncharacterized membrane protein YidH (DUF202 family)
MDTQTTKTGPKDVFLNLLSFGVLYGSIVSFLTMIFQYVNYAFPDPLDFYEGRILDTVRTSTSVLIVMFPIFLILCWMIEKDFKANPEKRDLKFRKWLTYLTLLAAAITVIVALIVLVNSFYSGDLTTQFILKVATVLVVAAGTFGYYLWDVKRKPSDTSKRPRNVAWITAVIVLVGVVAGFFTVGSPAEQRAKRFDEQRVSDLQDLQNQIINYWSRKGTLPGNIDKLQDEIFVFEIPVDPETKEDYEYTVLGGLKFELCATFNKSTERRFEGEVLPREKLILHSWEHDAGRVCFDRTIDPELHKLENGLIPFR